MGWQQRHDTNTSVTPKPRAWKADPMDTAARDEVDPRVERSRRVICRAAIEELADVGYGAMTIESIAKRAGVSKATLYRHWDGKLDLVSSALATAKDDLVVPNSGPVRERLTHILTYLATYLDDDNGLSACIPALVSASQYDDSVRDFHHRNSRQHRQIIIDIVQAGIDSGEITRSTDARLITEALVGPLFYCRLMTPTPFEPDRVQALIDLVL
ncbi:MAG: TetR/AcrR family transcriptional regulator [Ilumatobacteraceae bacterium]